MMSFLAIYRGPSVDRARLVGVTSDPDLVAFVAEQMVTGSQSPPGERVLGELERGRQRALEMIGRGEEC